jgi:NADPH-dependent curcumin reductase CurA
MSIMIMGGEISDAVVAINFHARIALCGQIALYNSKEVPMGPRLQPAIDKKCFNAGVYHFNYEDRFLKALSSYRLGLKES